MAAILAFAGVAHAQPGLSEPVATPPATEPEPEPEADAPDLLFRFEVGALRETAQIAAMVGRVDDQETGILPESSRLSARGLSVRMMLGPRAMPVYMGLEATVGWLDAPPTVLPPRSGVVPSAYDPDDEDWTPDAIIGLRFIAGGEGRLGRLFVGGEVGAGVVSVQLGGETDVDPWVHDPRFALDLRGRAGVWLTPSISAAVMTSTSLLRSDERSVQLMLGFAFGD